MRLGDTPQENGASAPGPLQSLVEDIQRIAGGEEPLLSETRDMKQETRSGWVERTFSTARETRRVVRYNAGEIQKWFEEVPTWLAEVLW